MKKKNRNSTKTHPFILQLPVFPRGVFQEKGGLFLADRFTSKTITIENVLEDGERKWKSGRGRKYASGRISPSFIVGGVDTLVEKGKAKNIHAAFPEIAEVAGYESETGGGSDYVKKIYYTALKHDEYRPLVEWIDPNEPLNLESLIASIKECVSKGLIWSPENLKETMKQIIQTYGLKKAREIESVYVGELEKLLTVETDNEAILAAKKWLKESGIIKKHRRLQWQFPQGDKNL